MAMISGSSATTYDAVLQGALAKGWIVLSEGPSGAQLKRPKEMKALDKWCIGLGVPLILLFGVGFILVAFGLIDYALFTKDKTFFVGRISPASPTDR
jgi:hypothetical protein